MNSDVSGNRPVAEDYGEGKILLVVDDDPRICRMVTRRLLCRFEALLTACTAAEAEQTLMRERVSHLVCDNDLGGGAPRGTALIAGWRSRYPSIERAVLFTGGIGPDEAASASGIDAVVYKTTDFDILTRALGL